MNESEKKTLTRNLSTLLDNVSPGDVLPYLQQEGVISIDDQERIMAEKTRKDKVRVLLNMLPYRGKKAYPVLRDALNGEYSWLVDQLDVTIKDLQSSRVENKKEAIKDLNHKVFKRVSQHPDVLRDWRNVGRCLGLDESDLTSVEFANQLQIKEAAYQMLVKWKTSKGRNATPSSLISALRECGFHHLADELQGE